MLESIAVRLFDGERAGMVATVFGEHCHHSGEYGNGLEKALLFRDMGGCGDWMILLFWSVDFEDSVKSILGRGLAHALRELGLVHHSIWREEQKADCCQGT